VLGRFSGSLTLKGDDKAISVAPLALTLDDSKLNGNVQVVMTEPPAIRARLDIDQIDLDRYMPPHKDGDSAGAAAAKGPAGTAQGQLIPSETLKQLNVVAELGIGNLTANKLRMSQVKAKLSAKDGLVQLEPVTADLYDGKLDFSATVDARREPPVIQINQRLTGIQAGPLLQDMQGSDTLTGTGNYSSRLTTKGQDDPTLRRNLNGNIAFDFRDGAVNGINVAAVIRDAKAKLGMGKASSGNEPEKTDFSELTGTAVIKDGILTNRDLQAKSPLLRIDGKGDIDVVQEQLDYRIAATLVGSLEGQGGKGRDELSGIPIPVRITGSWADPSISPDMEELAKAVAKSKLDEKVDGLVGDKLEKQLGEGAGKEVKGLLKGLF